MTDATLLDRMAEAALLVQNTANYIDDRTHSRRIALAVARVLLSEPADDKMAEAARTALRESGLLPAYTDKGRGGQLPILHVILKESALASASAARLAALTGGDDS